MFLPVCIFVCILMFVFVSVCVFKQEIATTIITSDFSLYCRYIFNCGEGLQRLFTQWKVKFGKIDLFFLTRYQWSHMGGFPGFGMTLRDIKR